MVGIDEGSGKERSCVGSVIAAVGDRGGPDGIDQRRSQPGTQAEIRVDPRNRSIVRLRGSAVQCVNPVQFVDVEDDIVPLGAWLPAGPVPKPDTVVIAAKLELSSTVTSEPSDFFMWTS